MADNPLPAIHGRVCYHPCENACNREHLDSAVSIHSRRALPRRSRQREGLDDRRRRPPTGKRVLVVGAGPSGLSCRLPPARGSATRSRSATRARAGRHDALRHPRLPPAARGARRRRSRASRRWASRSSSTTGRATCSPRRQRGGSTRSSCRSARTSPSTSTSRRGTRGKIIDAVALLRSVAEGERRRSGAGSSVYGGGNTAMDAARVAKRLGAEEAVIVYRRDRAQMPAHADEAEDAEREGVKINWLRTIKEFDGPELTVELMELDDRRAGRSRPGSSRRSRPTPSCSRSARTPTSSSCAASPGSSSAATASSRCRRRS